MADLEDEHALMNDVDILAVKIEQAGFKFDTQRDKKIRKNIEAHESRDARIKNEIPEKLTFKNCWMRRYRGFMEGASVVAASGATSLAKGHALPTRAPLRSKSDKSRPALSYIFQRARLSARNRIKAVLP